jgi:hypothetical protein
MKGITSEVEQLRNHINLFRSKYSALPGDYRNAGALWGNDCANSTGGSDTCSGNGNGLTLENDIGSTTSESLRAWQHLVRAKIVTYSLSGMPLDGCTLQNCTGVGINILESRFPSAGYSFFSGNDDDIRLAAFLGSDTADSWNSTAALDPNQAAGIDQKVDDGNPVTGQVRGSSIPGRTGGIYASCINDSVSGSEVYRVANEGLPYCTPAFILVRH